MRPRLRHPLSQTRQRLANTPIHAPRSRILAAGEQLLYAKSGRWDDGYLPIVYETTHSTEFESQMMSAKDQDVEVAFFSDELKDC